MKNHEVNSIPLVTHRPFAKFATEPRQPPSLDEKPAMH